MSPYSIPASGVDILNLVFSASMNSESALQSHAIRKLRLSVFFPFAVSIPAESAQEVGWSKDMALSRRRRNPETFGFRMSWVRFHIE